MHERSLARNILREIDVLRQEYPQRRVTAVELEVGLMSGVETVLLASALDDEQNPTQPKMDFKIQSVPLLAHCDQCSKSFEIESFVFACTNCGSQQIEITQGESVRILTITLDEPI
jgi:hydrogenase nickel incorporation protein HypA/HybF